MAIGSTVFSRMGIAVVIGLSAFTGTAFADEKEVFDLEAKYAYMWVRVRSLPDEERHAALEPLLREAEQMSPRPLQLLCGLAERLDRHELRVKYAREWIETVPEEIEPHAELVAALSLLPDSDGLPAALESLLDRLRESKEPVRYETALRHLLIRHAELEAAEVLVSGIESKTLEPLDVLMLSLSFQKYVHPLLQVKSNDPRQAEIAAATLKAIEAIAVANLASSSDYVRTDILMVFFRTYASALKFSDDRERSVTFLDRMAKQVQESSLPEAEKAWCAEFFDKWKTRFLFHAGRREDAVAHARERANREIVAYEKSDKQDAAKVLDAFGDCFEIFPRGQLRELMDRYASLELEDASSMSDKLVARNSEDEDEKNRVQRNQYAWIDAQKRYYLRMLAEGEYRLAAAVAARLSELPKFVGQNGEPVFDAESEYGEWLIGFAAFSDVLTEPYARLKSNPFGTYFNLQNELWMRGEPRISQELQGKVVILSLSSVGSSTDPRPPRSIPEIKLALDLHLSEEGLDGSGPEIVADQSLGTLYESYPRASLEIIGLVDDDFDSQYSKADDQWHPFPVDSTKYILKSQRANHPVVYTYQSKFLDALIADGQPRLIVFDQEGRLVRVIDGVADSCEFETLQETVERLLKTPLTTPEDEATKTPNGQPSP